MRRVRSFSAYLSKTILLFLLSREEGRKTAKNLRKENSSTLLKVRATPLLQIYIRSTILKLILIALQLSIQIFDDK